LEWTNYHDAYTILAISVDIAIDTVGGDLTNDATVSYWISEIRSGRVVYMVCGPPCETWSQARFLFLENGEGPPPLRTRLQPWGLQGLTLKQYRQLGLANKLLFTCLRFFVALLHAGGGALLEHPARPFRVQAPSLLYLKQTRWLLKSEAVELRTFKQSIHGQYAVKPTSLLCLRSTCVQQFLYSKQTDHGCMEFTGKMKGVTSEGTFHTAQAKEYTPSLCLAIAKTIHTAISERQNPEGHDSTNLFNCDELADRYARYVVKYDPYCEQQYVMGQDCALNNPRGYL
jgi:hypothetical protein